MKPQDLLTTDEHSAIDLAAQLAGLLQKIIGDGPNRANDIAEAELYIHGLQNMIMSQAAARAYPDLYRQLGRDVKSDKAP
jgi:hypothetical protein